MFEIKGLPLGKMGVTKKGGFIRKFLVRGSDGANEVLTVYSRSPDPLDGLAERTLRIRPGDLVFFGRSKQTCCFREIIGGGCD